MRIYQQGGENPTFRKILLEHTDTIAVSWWGIRARIPKTKPYDLRSRLGDSAFVIVGAGNPQDRDPASLDIATGALHGLVEANVQEMDFAIEVDAYAEYDRILDWREEFWDHLPSGKFCPVWKPGYGLDELKRLCVTYHRVAVTAAGLHDPRAAAFLRTVRDVHLHGLGIADMEALSAFPLESVSNSAWTNPMRHGEIIYWDGQQIRRHSKDEHEEGIRRARQFAHKVGLEPSAVDAKDGIAALAVRAYSALAQDSENAVVGIAPLKSEDDLSQLDLSELVMGEEMPLNLIDLDKPVSRKPKPRAKSILPILSVTQEEVPDEEHGGTKNVDRISPSGRQLLACDNCALSDKCPEFDPGSECAFDIPIQLRSRDDVSRFLSALLEIQGQRVMFGRFIEQLEGGYPDPNISSEMDRFFKVMQIAKDIEDNRDYLKINVETRANAGVLSRLFGSKVGEQARELDEPIDTSALTTKVDDQFDR